MGKPYVWVMTTEYAPFIIGGLGTVATELTRSLMASNVKISVISQSRGRSVQKQNNNIVRIPTIASYYNAASRSYKPSSIQQVTRQYFPRMPDVIHVHSMEFAMAALFLKKKYRIPVIYTCHSLVSMEHGSRIGRSKIQDAIIQQADKIVVPSFWLMKEIQKRHAGTASKIKVIPHGVRSAAKVSKAPATKLLFVGRLLRAKGIEPLIRSISLLSAKNKRVRLSIVGEGSPHYKKSLRSIARKGRVSSKIRWVGSMPHGKVQRLYSSYGAVIIPSEQESFCLVALEAMANGIPLVSSRAGGLREFVTHQNAQIIPAIESRAIVRAIKQMWKNPHKTRQRVANARQLAKRYNWRRTANRYIRLFLIVKNMK